MLLSNTGAAALVLLLQVILPVEGCRVVMASDGLWDVLTFTKVNSNQLYLAAVC
jgi:serine/threonine protein phosphatase PrpC